MKQIAIIGLGKMGYNIALKATECGYKVLGTDIDSSIKNEVIKNNIDFYNNINEILENYKEDKKVFLLSLPAGEITNKTIDILINTLNKGDIIIDGGNSHYKNSLENGTKALEKEVEFVDAGISGGINGARNGGCFMVGGNDNTINFLEKFFIDISIKNGFYHTGKIGSGHFAKMIHNGIEYGMMQAIAEGFNIIKSSSFDYDMGKLANVWNHGSIITSSLMGWTKKLFDNDGHELEDIPNYIKSSGEGLWTVQTALELNVSAPVITTALLNRIKSNDKNSFGDKVVSGMRKEFGGHDLK